LRKLNFLDLSSMISLGSEIRRLFSDLNRHFLVPPAFDYRKS
jgi:hypothetical protein